VETKKILDSAYVKAQEILKGKEELLHTVTAVLIEREKIDGEEFAKLWNGEELPPFEKAVKEEKEKSEPTDKPEEPKIIH